jgi:hypothetical protein
MVEPLHGSERRYTLIRLHGVIFHKTIFTVIARNNSEQPLRCTMNSLHVTKCHVVTNQKFNEAIRDAPPPYPTPHTQRKSIYVSSKRSTSSHSNIMQLLHILTPSSLPIGVSPVSAPTYQLTLRQHNKS